MYLLLHVDVNSKTIAECVCKIHCHVKSACLTGSIRCYSVIDLSVGVRRQTVVMSYVSTIMMLIRSHANVDIRSGM